MSQNPILRQKNLVNKNLFGILFYLLSYSFVFSNEYTLDENHKIQIRPVSNFVSELKVIDVNTNKILHESLMGMHYIIKTKKKKISGKNIFFVQATMGGEGMVSSNLYYFYLEGNELKQGAVEDIIEFRLKDLDGDKNKELILTDYKYYKFKLNNCYNALEPDPQYSGKLLPVIYTFDNGKFIQQSKNEIFLKNYLKKIEKKIIRKKKFRNLRAYTHYYAVSKSVGYEKQALSFIKSNNEDFTYICQNTKEQNPKGKSFQWPTNYFDFFKKYGKQIKE